ncbi:hypothetical protein [Aquimarina sp. RZ0]|uniref:hypothetical protein n=1 Tax=Aquimarina sp. RZ0 TaxID=2607730 RepID=UPI0011F1A17D|nr:hypothetical protein [Aquimarina sp. RZ0]KAA1239156.1 hypothetical protein F0000_27425 [Aquimarina sp. RZ0]
MKLPIYLILYIFPLITFCQVDYNDEETFRDKMDVTIEELLSTCTGNQRVGISSFNKIQEFWEFSSCYKTNKIISIMYYSNQTKFEELYVIQNDKLIYAKESEIGIPINSFDVITWNCQYYFNNEKLYTHISLGHGKTESENWNPESIIDTFQNRLIELEKIKK